MDKYVLDESADKVEMPLWVIGGVDAPRSPPEQLPEWERYTTGTVQIKTFPGGHFFLKEREGDLLAWLSKVVEELRRERGKERGRIKHKASFSVFIKLGN